MQNTKLKRTSTRGFSFHENNFQKTRRSSHSSKVADGGSGGGSALLLLLLLHEWDKKSWGRDNGTEALSCLLQDSGWWEGGLHRRTPCCKATRPFFMALTYINIYIYVISRCAYSLLFIKEAVDYSIPADQSLILCV